MRQLAVKSADVAIALVIDATKNKIPETGLAAVESLFVSRRPKPAYRVETRQERLPADAVMTFAIDVGGLRVRIDREVARVR